MPTKKNTLLFIAALLSFVAALLHIFVILGGPDWYRAFGAGEQMALMAERGELYPTFVTLFIASVLSGWGLYALSGAGYILKLPFLRICLVLITSVYCIRGAYGFFLPFITDNAHVQNMGMAFWFMSSAICLCIGICHLLGLKQSWQTL